MSELRESTKPELKKLEFVYIPDILVDEDEEIGRGSYGIVYRITKQFEDRKFHLAVKIFKNVAFKDPKKSKFESDTLHSNIDILNEIKSLELLNNSGFLVYFYGCTSIDGNLGIVMGYIGNMTLKHWIYNNDKSEEFISHIPSIQLGIASGLAFLHEMGVVHNDFKSDNVMLDESFRAKIIDLGLSKRLSTVTDIPEKPCTPNWRAPEYWDLKNTVNSRRSFPYAGDIYSFGVVLGELHNKNEGKSSLPWNSVSRSEDIGHIVLNGERPYSEDTSNIPSEIYSVIEKCWKQEPRDRVKMSEIVELLKLINGSEAYTKDVERVSVTNYAKIRELYENRAALGDANGIYNLGFLFTNGLGVAVDYIKARELFEKSSKMGNAYAMSGLGILYHYGLGVEVDYVKARELYEIGVASDIAYAMNCLGSLYHFGLGVEVDYIKARDLFEKGTALGNDEALHFLGILYHYGKGVEVDYLKAIELYEKGTALGNAFAMNGLGILYHKGLGVEVDYMKARELYEKGTALGNHEAMNSLGILYNDGLGVEVNYTKARELYEQSVALGNDEAMNCLGLMYNDGLGVDVDFSKARELFEKSVALGNHEAMNNLGIMYNNGLGVEVDYVKARELYLQAHALGNSFAMNNLSILEKEIKYHENGSPYPTLFNPKKHAIWERLKSLLHRILYCK